MLPAVPQHRRINQACVLLLLCIAMNGCNRDERAAKDDSPLAATIAAHVPEMRGFNGVFHATDGSSSVLNITDRDGHVTGMLDSVALFADSSGSEARGQIRQPRTGAVLGRVQMSLQDSGQLMVTLTAGEADPATALKLPPVTYVRGAPRPVDVLLDAQLVGHWRHTRKMNEGTDDTAAADVWLILGSDGSVHYGRSRSTSSVSALVGLQTTADDGFTGRWRTEDRVLHVMPGGSTHWVPLARYHRDADVLQLTYHDGAEQRFQRE